MTGHPILTAWMIVAALFPLGAATAVGQSPGPNSVAWNEEPSADVAEQLRAMQQQLDQLRAQIDHGFDPAASGTYPVVAGMIPGDGSATAPLSASSPAPPPLVRYPTLTVNGVFQADAGFFSQDPINRATVGNAVDGADFRRARLSAKGAVTDTVNYFFQMDFAFFGRPTITDIWLEQTNLPVLGNFRIGQWKQPFSLEVVSSFRYTTFMERSLLFQTFTPFRHLGAGFYDHSEDGRMTWAVSGFRSGQDQFGGSATNGSGWGTAERITWLPWYDEASNGRGYCHLGLGHYFAAPPDNAINFRTIPEMFIGQQNGIPNGNQQPVPGNYSGTPFFLQTGTLAVNSFNVVGVENLLVLGRFSWQTEVMVNFVNRVNAGTAVFPGFYSQVGYFLTGEHRPYDRKAGAIDRVMPFEDFFRVCTSDGPATGWGAWEVAARVSYLDFNDVDNVVAPGTGGDLWDTTLGVNWYWNPYTKLAANWVHSFLDNPQTGDSESDSFAMRAQIDF